MKQFTTEFIKAIRSRTFTKILACYGIILAVLASACTFSFINARRISLESITKKNELVLENAAKTIESALQMIESFNTSLYANSSLQSFMCARNGNRLLYSAYLLIQELPQLYDPTGLITGYYIYSPMSEYIIAPGQGFSNIALYYKDHFAISSRQSYEEWKQAVLKGPDKAFHADAAEGSSVLYATRLASQYTGVEACRVVYKLSASKLINLISRSFSDVSQYAYIADAGGSVLCAAGDDSVTGKDEHTRVSCAIARGGLTACILIPTGAISAQAADSLYPFLIVLLWMLVFGLILIIITAIANLKPLLRVAERAKELGGSARGMWRINEAFEHVDRKSAELQNTLMLQKEYMKTACVHRLIHGNGTNADSLEEMLANADIIIHGSRFYACVIALNEEYVSAHAQTLALEVVSKFSKRLTVLSLDGAAVMYALYSETDEEADERKSFFTDVYNALQAANIEAKFCIGSVCFSPDKLSESFAVANWLNTTSTTDTWLNLSDSAPEEPELSGILSEAEQTQLKAKILSGDSEGAKSALKALENAYFIERSTHGFRRQYIYCRLVEVLVACMSSLEIGEELPADLMLMPSKEFFRWLTDRMLCVSELAKKRLQIKSSQLGEKVFRYIEENYADYELTLNSLSAHLKVTGPYLSGLFKKQTGTNFSAYLESVRIRAAEALLRKDDMSVDELAQKVGYSNSDSFRRAFKRVKGVTPTQFREGL